RAGAARRPAAGARVPENRYSPGRPDPSARRVPYWTGEARGRGGTMPVDQSAAAAQGPWRILLTEDDGPVRARLAALREDWSGGELVGVCANLTDCLAAIDARTIDLLITDLKLPDGNGIDAIRALRRAQPDAE